MFFGRHSKSVSCEGHLRWGEEEQTGAQPQTLVKELHPLHPCFAQEGERTTRGSSRAAR
jgi:hypothetical protein